MADVTLNCKDCGNTITLSEFATAAASVCQACGGAYEKTGLGAESEDSHADKSRLRVLRRGPDEGVTLRGETVAPKPSFEHAPRVIPGVSSDQAQAKPRRSPGRSLGALVLLAAGILFIGPQAVADSYPTIHSVYLSVRLYLLMAIWIGVTVEALRESSFRGLLSLFFPPYVLLYALSRVERAWLRSLVLAAALMLGAEMHFLGDTALLRQAQESINSGIRTVEGLIQRASGP